MTQAELKEALSFYGINDEARFSDLAEALDRLNKSPSVSAAFETARTTYFTDDTAGVATFWNHLNDEHFFGVPVEPSVYDLFLLSGWDRHKKQMERFHFDSFQAEANQAGIRFELEHIREATMHRVLWGVLRINGKITEFGRLTYEYLNLDGKLPVNTVRIHIPATGKLDDGAVKESLSRAKRDLALQYGVKEVEITCTSWLLSPQIVALCDESSNIHRFAEHFAVTEGNACSDEILSYVYHIYEPTDYRTLPEDTSLQRAVKRHLLAGGDFRLGKGVLKPETLG